jgi:hypothetical protein
MLIRIARLERRLAPYVFLLAKDAQQASASEAVATAAFLPARHGLEAAT